MSFAHTAATAPTELRHRVVDDMIAIELDQLNEAAALQTRIDRKYVIPSAAVDLVMASLPDSTAVLEIDGSRRHRYHSVYFDTPRLDSYHDAGRSRRRRWKLRTRSYVDSGGSFLELKTRGANGATVKERIDHPDGVGGLSEEGIEYAAAVLGAAVARSLRPTLSTSYTRSTLLLADDGARATIDTQLCFASATTSAELETPHLSIVESKSGASPSAMDRTLWRLGHRPVSLSKYGVGMAALNPDLPRLKWHRVLTRNLHIERKALR